VGETEERMINIIPEIKFDRRNRKRTEAEKASMRLGIDNFRSFLKSQEKDRGIQSLCRACARSCKVLNAPDSTFVCSDFMEKKK